MGGPACSVRVLRYIRPESHCLWTLLVNVNGIREFPDQVLIA